MTSEQLRELPAVAVSCNEHRKHQVRAGDWHQHPGRSRDHRERRMPCWFSADFLFLLSFLTGQASLWSLNFVLKRVWLDVCCLQPNYLYLDSCSLFKVWERLENIKKLFIFFKYKQLHEELPVRSGPIATSFLPAHTNFAYSNYSDRMLAWSWW